MNAILGMYTDLDEVTNLQCDYLETLDKCECLEKELSKSKMMSESFEALQKHAINLELDLQQARPKPNIPLRANLGVLHSLRLEDEHLDTIPETESDEFIKSSFENLVPNPSESKDLSDNISKEIYSNPLFDEEIISMKIDPHHFNVEFDLIESLLNHDSSIISFSLKIDSFLDEFAGELILLKTIPPGIDETDCDPEEEIRLIEKLLYDNLSPRPPEEFISENSDAAIESFSPSPIPAEDSDSLMEEIDLSFTLDALMPSGINEDDYNSEKDILFFEELLGNNSISLPKNESFHFDIPSFPRPPSKPPDDDSGILTVKMVGDISEHDVPMPKLLPTSFQIRKNLLISYLIGALKLLNFILNAR
nr:hypothetical protein [Tanacetum cinerariifolium]